MILPAFDQLKGEFPVDELLAVMCDNLNNLTFCGVKIATSKRGDTKHYSVNFLNFSCREDLLKVFRTRVKKTKLTHLANTEQYFGPRF
ncbi:hypothetical protein WICPIJ_005520 [Wickerhamomyces pijperi]|uniref:Uncharacterized protein n=1 Tax=Wickerhamomyces pijperi TaxID=599730 RepID=A0A9P8TLV9_WICPI|nr:hypothetical protein WICPIJ_005520 [Wickerhamomyces pijperi]